MGKRTAHHILQVQIWVFNSAETSLGGTGRSFNPFQVAAHVAVLYACLHSRKALMIN